jgi:hypothetical protein
VAAFVGASEGPVAPPGGHGPHGPLGGIVAHAETAIIEEAPESVNTLCSLSRVGFAMAFCKE